METRKLSEEISLGAQPAPEDMARIAAMGFRAVICNRPDGEAPGQPAFAEIEAAARAAGLEARHLPVAPGRLSEDLVAGFAAALDEMPGPVFAYCRSGTRSAMLWALTQASERPADELVADCARAGFDIRGVAPLLAARAG